MKQLVLVTRLVFGAWMLLNGANHFFLGLWALPTGHEPLAVQLMSAFVHSGLINVAMAIELIAGALILAGVLVPVALCVVMPVSTCALYWSVILEREPVGAVLALVAFALNGFLMFAYIDYYAGALKRRALTVGESASDPMFFDALFASPAGRTSRAQFVPALIVVLVVAAFYVYFVTGRTAQFCTGVLLIPALLLHARRLHDMGHSAWLLVIPGALMAAAFGIWVHYFSFGAQIDAGISLLALVVSAGFAVWGSIGKSQAEANDFGPPVQAKA